MNWTASITLILANICASAWAAQGEDGFDQLYTKRIQLMTKQLEIYDSLADQDSAVEAADKWRALLPLVREIRVLTEGLGQPSADRLAQLSRDYSEQISRLSTRRLEANRSMIETPASKALQVAQLEAIAAVNGAPGINQAIAAIKGDPAALAAMEETRLAVARERAAIATDPAIDAAYEAYLASTRELAALLVELQSRPETREAVAKASVLVQDWESKRSKFDAYGPAAVNTTRKYRGAMKTDLGALVEIVTTAYQDKATTKPLLDVLQRIMAGFSSI